MSDDQVEKNKVVSFTYSIMDENGVAQEENDIPMSYIHGVDKQVFPEVVKVMQGARVGDTKEIVLTPENGFGEFDPNKTFHDKAVNVPPEFQKIGAEANFQNESGDELTMRVISIENGEIHLDGNHPFAGKTMTFRITIKSIRDATVDEITSGISADNPTGYHQVH